MPSPATIDIDALMKPIKGDFPAGKEVDFVTDKEIKEWRKEQDPANFSPSDPNRPKAFQPPKWMDIVRLCKTKMAEETKYPSLPAFLTEALIRTKGYAGARDGFKLLERWAATYLEQLYPVEMKDTYAIESHQDFDRRLRGLKWLEESEQEKSLRDAPILHYVNPEERVDVTISLEDVAPAEKSQTPKVPDEKFNALLARVPENIVKDTLDDINACGVAIEELLTTLKTKVEELLRTSGLNMDEKTIKDEADKKIPGLMRCKKAIKEASEYLAAKLEAKASMAGQPGAAGAGAGVAVGGAVMAGVASIGQSRDQLYDQLKQIAAQLEKLDAHSPVPLLILKAVQLREMKFPKLVELLNSDARVLQFITPSDEKKD